MGLFSRTSSPKHSSNPWHGHSGSKSSGLEPVSATPREDGKGDYLDAKNAAFEVGVASDWNSRYRKSMEDSSVVILDYMGIKGCAYFAIFDGHAGAQCSAIVAERLHGILAEEISAQPAQKDVAKALSDSFEKMDEQLKSMDIKHSGATAVVAVSCYMNQACEIVSKSTSGATRKLFVANVGDSRAVLGTSVSTGGPDSTAQEQNQHQHQSSPSDRQSDHHHASSESLREDTESTKTVADVHQVAAVEVKRLSYDHRCNDVYEQRRVSNAGGIMINNRVNGMLAVTRSLGDLFMKDYVVGSPYTTETDLTDGSTEVLVMACDGLWDVCTDDKAVQLAHSILAESHSALAASQELLSYALAEFSVDNVTIMVLLFKS